MTDNKALDAFLDRMKDGHGHLGRPVIMASHAMLYRLGTTAEAFIDAAKAKFGRNVKIAFGPDERTPDRFGQRPSYEELDRRAKRAAYHNARRKSLARVTRARAAEVLDGTVLSRKDERRLHRAMRRGRLNKLLAVIEAVRQ